MSTSAAHDRSDAGDVDLNLDYNPFIGPQLDCPFPIWKQSRREQPVFHSDVLDAWVVTRYADIVAVLRDTDTFGPGYGSRKLFAEACPEADRLLADLPSVEETNTISTEPPLHTKLRHYLQAALIPQRVDSLTEVAQEIGHRLVDEFIGAGSGDFYALYGRRFPLMVIGHLIGLPSAHFERVAAWANDRVALRFGNRSAAEQVAAARGQHESHLFTSELVRRRRAEPGDDLISSMVQESDTSGDPLSDDQMAAQVTDLLSAGHETSAHFLTLLVRRVVADRGMWAQLRSDDDLRTAVINEALRIDGPAHSIWRNAKRDTEIAGVPIHRGARVSLVLGSANLDEDVFDDPDNFDVTRPNVGSHIAFGRGIHTCLGASVARMEARVSLEVLSTRLPRLRAAAQDRLSFRPSANLRAADRLMVDWT